MVNMLTKKRLKIIVLIVLVVFALLAVFVYFNKDTYKSHNTYTNYYLFPVQKCEQFLDLEIESGGHLELNYEKCTCYGSLNILESYPPQYMCDGKEVCHSVNETKESVCKDNYEKIKRWR